MAWDEFVIHQWPAPELRQPYVLGGRHQHPALVSEERRDCCRRGLQDLPSGARLSDGDETAPGGKGVVETGPWQQDAWTRAHLSHLLVTSSTRLRFPEPRPPLWLSPARSGVRLGAGQLRGARETWMAEPSEPRSRREPPTAHMNSPQNGLSLLGSGNQTGGRDDSVSIFRADKRNKLVRMAPGASGVQTPGCGLCVVTPSISGSPELLYGYRI